MLSLPFNIRSSIINFSTVFAVIGILKLLVFYIIGTTIEIDTYNYAFNALNFEYPPLYPYLLRFSYLISPVFSVAALLQVLIFSICASFFVLYFAGTRREHIFLSLLLGVEPVSSFFCTDIMSESIFIPTLLLWLIALHKFFNSAKINFWVAGIVGVLCGFLYLERFAGVIFLVIFFILPFFISQHRSKIVFALLLALIGFQLTILPVRLKYRQVFGTYRINGVTGAMFWNNASVLYPGSAIKQHPQSFFEEHLPVFEQRSDFTQYNAIKGRHLNDFELPYRAYIIHKGYAQDETPRASDEVGSTALRLIKGDPFGYFRYYVVPNFIQYFKESDNIDASSYYERLSKKYILKDEDFKVVYPPILYSAGWAVLMLCTILYWKGRRSLAGKIILLSSWIYLLTLPFISIMSIRFVLVIMPLLVFLLYVQFRGKSAAA